MIFSLARGKPEDLRQHLIEHPESVYECDERGFTPLHAAASTRWENVALLLSAGAKIDAQVKRSNDTPFHYAILNGRFDAAKILVDAGCGHLDIMDRSQNNVFHMACEYKSVFGEPTSTVDDPEKRCAMIESLTWAGCPFINRPNHFGELPLNIAVFCGTPAMIISLIRNGSTLPSINQCLQYHISDASKIVKLREIILTLRALGSTSTIASQFTNILWGTSDERFIENQAKVNEILTEPIPEEKALALREVAYFSRSLTARLLIALSAR